MNEFIELLKNNELALAKLYETFASVFPEVKQEWLEFAKEEYAHASWISSLDNQMAERNIAQKETTITKEALQRFIEHIEHQIKIARETDIDLEHALAIAIDIEKSLVESAFLKVFNFKNAKLEKVQQLLFKSTVTHRDKMVTWQRQIKTLKK